MECAKYENVQNMKMCIKWNGMGITWNGQKKGGAKCGICTILIVQNMECGNYGMCKICAESGIP